MKKAQQTTPQSRRLAAWLLCLAAILLPQYASATYVDESYNYQVMLSGANTIKIQMPLYDQEGADCWIQDGYLNYTIVGGTGEKTQLLHVKAESDIDQSRDYVYAEFYFLPTSSYVLTPGTGNPIYFDMEHGYMARPKVSRSANSTNFSVTIVWTVPAELRGKTLRFEWDIMRNGNSRSEMPVPLDPIDITIPEPLPPSDPMLTQAIILPDNVGKVVVPWYIAAQNVSKVEAIYQDRNGAEFTITLEPTTNGNVVLPATTIHKQLYLNVDYYDNYGYLVAGRQSSPKTDIPIIHNPVNFTATPIDDGKGSVRLDWQVSDPDYPDLLETDLFEIWRSITGKEEDFRALTGVFYEVDSATYSFTDSTLLADITNSDLDYFGDMRSVKYRIRRAATESWGWDGNPCAASTETVPHALCLLTPQNAKSVWENESEYKVKVTWDYATDPNNWGVWDKRAEMKLVVKSYNRDGELIDTQETILKEDEILNRSKVLSLSRPCVNYKIEIVVDPKDSPVGTSQKQILITSVEDWKQLQEIVRNGEGRAFNVKLMADLNLISGSDSALDYTIGLSKDHPFRGYFDGNGHTLTVNGFSPFGIVENVTVRNLSVDGITSNDGGLFSMGTDIEVENCRMYAEFSCDQRFAAAFIGYGGNLTFRNCLFAGKVTQQGDFSSWGGFATVYISSGSYNFSHCLSAPSSDSQILDNVDPKNGAGANFIYIVSGLRDVNTSHCYYKGLHWTSQSEYNGEELPATTEEQLAALGSEWEACESWPGIRPVMHQAAVPESVITIPVAGQDTNPTFYHESTGRVEKTLLTETRQSSVLLTWDTDGGVVDYFTVLRREKGTNKDFDIIADNLDNTTYEDTTVSPLLTYEYKVRSNVDCEGTHYAETDTVEGRCKDTGMVEGYLRFRDGTAAAGITVAVYHGSEQVAETVTDDSGYYMIDELSYYGGTSVTYTVGPVNSGSIHHKYETDKYEITFNATSNHEKLGDFIITSGFRFSGFVMFEGTSIPVKGAQFLVNGHKVYTSAGKPLESDFEGKYSFRVGEGDNIIQAVMDGHTFINDGYFKSAEGYNFTEDKSLQFFYDDTKVKLIGRIVGGDTQGDLPLDNNLSRNNLGSGLKMVLTLDGDNSSWLVYDNLHPNVSERDTIFAHTNNDRAQHYQTKVHFTRKRLEVSPDSLTGEYTLYLPPVRWKVQQIYNDGYSTLFQEGMTSEVIDLTDCTTEHTDTIAGTYLTASGSEVRSPIVRYYAKYNRIYHSPLELLSRQITYDKFDYLGEKVYVAQCVDGTKSRVPLAYEDAGSPTGVAYTFDHPVFSLNRSYPILLSAVERYYWNNNHQSDTIDVVKVGGGKVIVHNGLKNNTDRSEVALDDNGEGILNLEAEQMPRMLTGKEALRTVTLTLEKDGSTFETTPIQGYVLNYFPIEEGKDILSVGTPMLVDILRDPPGGGSTATLHRGSSLRYGYSVDMAMKIGLSFAFSYGTTLDNFSGAVAAPAGTGTTFGLTNSSNTEKYLEFEYLCNYEGNRSFNYNMSIENDITTSGSINMVGAPADIYMGMVQNMTVTTASTIRAIPDSIFRQMVAKLPGGALPTGDQLEYGTMVEIAQGRDANDSLYHLVRDESLIYGPKVESTFFHTQKYILNQLIPEHIKQCQSLMFTGTAEEAQRRANATGKPVYLSLYQPTDSLFGVMNIKDGEPYYYSSEMPEEDDMSYRIYLPQNTGKDYPDEVAQYWEVVLKWIGFIAQNEREKYQADDLVRNFDIDGGSSVSYSEEFSSEYATTTHLKMPGYHGAPFFEDEKSGENGSVEGGKGDTVLSFLKLVGAPILKYLMKKIESDADKEASISGSEKKDGDEDYKVTVKFAGKNMSFRILPVFDYSTKGVGSNSKSFSRRESFNIDFDSSAHLDFDVYRVKSKFDKVKSVDDYDVFTRNKFDHQVSYDSLFIAREYEIDDMPYSKSFVYRTRGGATARPWENARKTHFYLPGTVLDERTKKIENPKITLDKQSISGVPYGEPARFKVYLTNDSEKPEAATGALSYFSFYMSETANPHGAKLYVDGMPLTGAGRTIHVEPGKVTEKVLEVYAGEEFDYENLVVGLMSQEDFVNAWDEVAFDVHFLKQAGTVNISSPGDKWVMNTDAPYNEKRGYYIPVTISGFDKHQKNFDHIEFQYKETARGDDYWTNLCSYYADSTLMAKAGGVCEMIPANGNITTEFYGDGVIMEKAYDLRAVLFCRNGNSYLTTASKVLSGIKDTRRPQLFGEAEPADGILDIGESIIFNFTEDIEYNFLQSTTNFEVTGEVNNDNVSETVSLQFNGNSSVETEARRNFNEKDITIDMLIKPENTGKDMPLFSHGLSGKKLQLWLTSDKRLRAVVDKQTYETQDTITGKGFTQVAMVIKQPDADNNEARCHLTLFNGGTILGEYDMQEAYTGTGTLIFGRTNEANRNRSSYYKGRMKEARLWYRALDAIEIGTTYGFKRLSGYEMGLVDYYPMEDGNGDYALDKSQGAHATLHNATWAMPHGMSLHLEWEDRGIALKSNAITRTADEDYTLMFWFKTDDKGKGALISNGTGRATDIGAESQFFIGFDNNQLIYRSNGMTVPLPGNFSDNDWHHYAMTVNRPHNIVNIYVDKKLLGTFKADSIGGISGGHLLLGASVYEEKVDSVVNVVDARKWLRGNLDEICFFSQSLPLTLIEAYSTKSPKGEEAGLLTYLSFDRQERQADNDIEYVPYLYNRRIYKDDDGNIIYAKDPETQQPTDTPQRDYFFIDDIDKMLSHVDEGNAAPVMPYEELHNLDFSFAGRNNQLMVNINENEARLNRRHVYVTLREIPDKNGNNMASPVTACFYIDRSPLKWSENKIEARSLYGTEANLYIYVKNNGNVSHNYNVENLPVWMTVENQTGTLMPREIMMVTLKVNKHLNVGTYDEVIYLKDENGFAEPLYLTLIVEGEEPDWIVDSELGRYTMNISGRVIINDEIDTDPRDIVGVFDSDNVCHGVAHLEYDEKAYDNLVYLTIYDNKNDNKQLYFKLWRYETGLEMLLQPDTIHFRASSTLGIDKPVEFTAGVFYVQNLQLEKGWNWVSFYVYNDKSFPNANRLLSAFPWKNGDVITDNTENHTLVYKDGAWLNSDGSNDLAIRPSRSYCVNVQQDINVPISGTIIMENTQRTINVEQGWNSIGYTPILNLTVETALAGYYDFAEEGDIIKSHDEFAYFTRYKGAGHWQGNLVYMMPGEGYMLYRKSKGSAKFTYPFFEPGSTFLDEVRRAPSSQSLDGGKPFTMSVTAIADGVELEPGDRLLAFSDGDLRGVSSAYSDSLLYLSIEGDGNEELSFAIERDGDIIATTGDMAQFCKNSVLGTPSEPTHINFMRRDIPRAGWYTLDGIKLEKRPVKKGVYIYNGKKTVIEN